MTSGVVIFETVPNGEVRILAELAELRPGPHGIHIHEVGDCSAADATSAGAHFAPDRRTHGAPADTIHHAGVSATSSPTSVASRWASYRVPLSR